jgi:fatty-acyl-CoA synthase
LSHRNILNNGWFVGRAQQLGPGDRICVPVPLFHCFGMVMGNLAGVTCGATVICEPALCSPCRRLPDDGFRKGPEVCHP